MDNRYPRVSIGAEVDGEWTPTGVGGAGGGDASAANQVLTNNKLDAINAKTPTLGPQAPATSAPVVADDRPFKQVIDEASSTVTYICEAAPGTATSAASWRVKRISVSGTVTTISYAGTGVFDQIADNRAALTYN